jgi:cardiolipin synthase
MLNDKTFWALFVFVTASLTDGLDGYIARVYDLRTRLGAFLDPLADKLLLLTAYILLAVLGRLPLWLTEVVVARDMVILSGILCLYLTKKKVDFSPSILGKITTFVQLFTILLVLISTIYPKTLKVLPPIYVFNLVVTLGSCIHYLYLGFKIGSSKKVMVREGD